MPKKPVIQIEYDDWLEERNKSEIKLTSRDDILAAMQETDLAPSQAARLAIVERELGNADEAVLKSNKLNLMLGASLEISRMYSNKRVKARAANGKTYNIRQYVAHPSRGVRRKPDEDTEETELDAEAPAVAEEVHWDRDPADHGPTLVEYSDPLAVNRIKQYLFTNVTGRIEERLELLTACGEDVRPIAEELKSRIDTIVARLV